MARNALLGYALLGVVALGACSGGDDAEAVDAQVIALRSRTDSLRKLHPVARASADTAASATLAATPRGARSDSAVRADAEATMADSVQKSREIQVQRETFAYAGGTRDPFSSLMNGSGDGPEIGDLELVAVYQDLRSPSNNVVVVREKVSTKRYKLRVSDQVGRARLVQIRPRDAVFTIHDFGVQRQETLSLRKQEVETP